MDSYLFGALHCFKPKRKGRKKQRKLVEVFKNVKAANDGVLKGTEAEECSSGIEEGPFLRSKPRIGSASWRSSTAHESSARASRGCETGRRIPQAVEVEVASARRGLP